MKTESHYVEIPREGKALSVAELLHYIAKRVNIVLALALVCALLGCAYSIISDTTVYTASTRIYVVPFEDVESMEAQFSTIAVNDCKSIIVGENVAENVIKKLNLSVQKAALISAVEVVSTSNSRVIQINVTQNTPELAVKVANTLREEATSQIKSVAHVEDVRLIHEAENATAISSVSLPVAAVLGIAVGAVLSVCILAVMYLFDDTLRTDKDVTDCLALTTLSAIPEYRKPSAPSAVEAVNVLRTNFLSVGAHSVAVTGFGKAVGSSYVARALAASLAASDKKTLLIVADMRQGAVGSEKGLAHCLRGEASLAEAITTELDGLCVLYAGENVLCPSELLANSRYDALIAEARAQFEYIIVDTPPVGQVTDCASALRSLDGAILVINAKHNSASLEARAKSAVEAVGSRLIGAVINRADYRDRNGYYGRAHSGRYSYAK